MLAFLHTRLIAQCTLKMERPEKRRTRIDVVVVGLVDSGRSTTINFLIAHSRRTHQSHLRQEETQPTTLEQVMAEHESGLPVCVSWRGFSTTKYVLASWRLAL
jgi:translation elongation factor EF-1alpha